jgi:hypothetical protein
MKWAGLDMSRVGRTPKAGDGLDIACHDVHDLTLVLHCFLLPTTHRVVILSLLVCDFGASASHASWHYCMFIIQMVEHLDLDLGMIH